MTEQEIDIKLWDLLCFKGKTPAEQCQKHMEIRELYWELIRMKDEN